MACLKKGKVKNAFQSIWTAFVFLVIFVHSVFSSGQASSQTYTFLNDISKLASIAYCSSLTAPFICNSKCADFPNATLIQKFTTSDFTEIDGYVARDDSTARIIVAIRGTESFANTVVDALTFLSPTGLIPGCATCRVHSGFYLAWQAVEKVVKDVIGGQIAAHPNYQLVVTGHSLGGAAAALLGLSLKTAGRDPTVVTFGEPRVGNPAFASYVNNQLGNGGKIFRVTHGNDPVVQVPFKDWGFEHHSGEYWINTNTLPVATANLKICLGNEDNSCLSGQSFNPLKARDHLLYFQNFGGTC